MCSWRRGGEPVAGRTWLPDVNVYHRAGSDQVADEIDRIGFRDSTGYYLTGSLHTGVWVAGVPLDPNDYGVGQQDAPVSEVEADESLIAEWEWITEGQTYREWLIPSADLNRWPRRRILGDEEKALSAARWDS